MAKKFVLNSDSFGVSKEHNKAVLDGCNNGFLMSASIWANGEAFSAAINDILPNCQNIGLGIHLNITSGKSLTNCNLLTNTDGYFNGGFLYLWLNSNKKDFILQVENEFRAQIEKVKQYTEITHISSNTYIHSIPNLFEVTCKLAKEYNIPYVRVEKENFYTVDNFFKHICFRYPINLIKFLWLNYCAKINKSTANEFSIRTNDYVSGILYSGLMDYETVTNSLKNVDDGIIEAIINKDKLTTDKKLEDTINRAGFEITNYKNLAE